MDTVRSRQKFVLGLAGPIRLCREDDVDLTPGPAKIRALLVLIATGNGMRRSRAFLQDMLWSTADPARGGASLRQALSTARKLLGEDRDLLRVEHETVALDPERVRIDLTVECASRELPEFAEGLDVPDPEFEDWLRDRRSEFADHFDALRDKVPESPARLIRTPAPSQRMAARLLPAVIVTVPPLCTDPSLRTHAEILTADIAMQIAQTGEAEVRFDPAASGPDDRLGVQVRAIGMEAGMRFQVQLSELASGRIVWLGDCASSAKVSLNHDTDCERLRVQATAAATNHFGRFGPAGSPDPARLAYQMFAHFPFQDGPILRKFETWFDRDAGDCETRATLLAWRARLRLVSLLEGGGNDLGALDEARALSRAAIALAPDDPMVLAISADVALHAEGKSELSCDLAHRSVIVRPYNPFVRAIYAQALARAGRSREGYAAACTALRLANGQPNTSWWHAICAATAIREGVFDAARKHAEMAHFLAPTFRPPLRFLCGLRFEAGDEAGTAEALADLKRLEPNFCLDLMADQSYPVASLRGTPLLSVTASGLL